MSNSPSVCRDGRIHVHMAGMDPKQQPDGSFSMSPSTLNLLAQLDAEKCLGCCMQRSKILNEALTYCRIPGYVQPCADDGWSPLLIATGF